MNKQKKNSIVFKVVRGLVALFYPKMKIIGDKNIPDEPCIVVGNHSQLHGPIACELYFKDNYYTWCASQMMELKEVPGYSYKDFWSEKPRVLKSFFKILSYIIAPLSVIVFNNARTIAVYRDKRVLSTFRESVAKLREGKNVVVFPEHNKKYNNILCDFQEGFIDVARTYYKLSGKELMFVPLYIAPNLKEMHIGKAIRFSSQNPIDEERKRICDYLKKEITDIARNLPEHIVVPYNNISKRLYSKNTKY